MRKGRMIIGLCLLAVVASAIGAASASAIEINFLWLEKGVRLTANLGVSDSLALGATFNVRALVTNGGTHINVVIKCTGLTLKNGVIFDKLSSLQLIGQGQGELELSSCTSNACNTGTTIKLPPLGNGETTLVADEREFVNVHKIYDDFLPNSSKEFASFTLEGGGCLAKTYKIITKLARGGLGTANEGEGGILGEVDTGITETEISREVHRLKFTCNNGNEQVGTEAFNAAAKAISVGREEVEGTGNGPACLEGTIVVVLSNNQPYSVY